MSTWRWSADVRHAWRRPRPRGSAGGGGRRRGRAACPAHEAAGGDLRETLRGSRRGKADASATAKFTRRRARDCGSLDGAAEERRATCCRWPGPSERVAVIGPLADDRDAMIGLVAGDSRKADVVTVIDGIKAALRAEGERRGRAGRATTRRMLKPDPAQPACAPRSSRPLGCSGATRSCSTVARIGLDERRGGLAHDSRYSRSTSSNWRVR